MRGRHGHGGHHGGSSLIEDLLKIVDHSVRIKGHVTVDGKKCNLCGKCQLICPKGAIKVDRKNKKWIIYSNCNSCLRCVRRCPQNALKVVPM